MPHLTLSQRYQIGSLRHLKPAEIARRIGKDRSVVTRELARNGPTRHAYQPQTAHKRAAQRKRANALKMTPALTATITEGLAQQWSPDQIKGRCQQQGQPMLSRAAI
nr:helix-turn-helix domain-containing protein [Hymenobacter elongatus]